jgi:hypothetical protein
VAGTSLHRAKTGKSTPRDLWNTSPKISFEVELLLLGLRIVG